MGAHDFSTYGSGINLEEAFLQAKEEARWEQGHDSYNGTISTVQAAVPWTPPLPGPVPARAADDLASSIFALGAAEQERLGIRKWESCLGFPVADDEHFQWSEAEELIIPVNEGDDYRLVRQGVAQRYPGEWLRVSELQRQPASAEIRPTTGETPGGYILLTPGRHNEWSVNQEFFPDRQRAEQRAQDLAANFYPGQEVRIVDISQGQQEIAHAERGAWRMLVSRAAPNHTAPVSGWQFVGLAAS